MTSISSTLISSHSLVIAASSAVVFGFFFLLESWHRWLRRRATLPPGPPQAWFGLGDNRRDIPKHQPWKEYAKWHQRHGPVVSAVLGNTPIIVLGTLKAATDLLDKRGSIYSSRARNIIGGEILSGNMRGVGMPYGTRWRNWRALMHAGLSIEAAKGYKPLQSLESRILIRDLMQEKDPHRYDLHVRRFALSVVTSVGYGKRVKTLQDTIVKENIEIDGYFLDALAQGKFIVDSWPILMRLPRFLQWFRWTPEKMRLRDTRIYIKFLNEVRERIEKGTAMPCIATWALDKQSEWGLTDVELAYACSAPWQAGGSSTTAVFEIFIMAMLLHPSVMRKAQAELDSVVGRSRLPEFQDLDDLPYTYALVKEVQRWCPPIPVAVAHSNVCDDEYDGMLIPKGSIVFPNVYMMARDPEVFPDPDQFKPERFLGQNAVPMFAAAFGFGRRQCAGIHVATNSLFIMMSRLLWAFDIDPLVDPLTGQHTLPDPSDLQGDLIVHPKSMGYSLTLRGDQGAVAVITAEADRAEAEALAWTA